MYSRSRQNRNEWTLPFMAWELRLYLDTHPDDEKALAAYNQVCAKLDSCAGACNTQGDTSERWNWVDDPWPWQTEANIPDVPGQCCDKGE